MSSFEIRHTPANRDNSLPEHNDIHLKGDDDALVTVWGEQALAQEIVNYLDQYPQRRALGAPRKRKSNSVNAPCVRCKAPTPHKTQICEACRTIACAECKEPFAAYKPGERFCSLHRKRYRGAA